MNIKKAIKTAIMGLSLGFVVISARAYEITADDIKDYIDEMPELSYQLPAIDCNDAAVKISTMGAWWAIQQKWDVRKDPKIMAMQSTFGVLELASKMDLLNFEYIDSDNLKKGSEEVLETYKGFFIAGAYDGAKVNKKLSLKKTREKAKEIGWANGEFCKAYGETDGNLKMFIAYYRLHKGEF